MVPAELANFDDDQGHIVGEGAVPPRSHAVEDRLPHFRQWKLCRIEDQSCKAVDAHHIVAIIKDLDEPVGVENQTVAGLEVNLLHRIGWCCLGKTAENAVVRIE